jgi:S1-C subfamily serine protease
MTLDLGQSRLWLTPDAAAIGRPFERNRLGAALEPQEEGLKILHVALNSPAAAAGLAVGDVIVEVDGRRVTRDNRSELSQFGEGAAGEHQRGQRQPCCLKDALHIESPSNHPITPAIA